jgi:PAS domain S-box-containing protein
MRPNSVAKRAGSFYRVAEAEASARLKQSLLQSDPPLCLAAAPLGTLMRSSDTSDFWLVSWATDSDGHCLEIGSAWRRITGQSVDAASGDGWLQTIHPDDRDPLKAKFTQAADLRRPFKTVVRLRRVDGDYRWAMAIAAPKCDDKGECSGFAGTTIEFDDRGEVEPKTNAKSLREREAVLPFDVARPRLSGRKDLRQGLDEMLADTIELLGADKGKVQILDASRDVLTIAAQRGFGSDFIEFFEEISSDSGTACGRALLTGERVVIEDVKADGALAGYLEVAGAADFRAVQSTPLIGRDGAPLGVLSTHWRTPHRPSEDDLSRLDVYVRQAGEFIEHCKMTQALQVSRQQLALALDTGQLGFWDWDVTSGRAQFSGRWASMLGFDLSEIEPHVDGWETLIHPDEKDAVWAVLSEHLAGDTEFYECEHRLRHKNGSWRWVLTRGRVVERDADGRPLRAIGTHADVTDRHEAEAALQEADRRKDEFIATLAHELRNPLAPIRNAAHVLKKKYGPQHPDARIFDMVQRQVDHLVRLVDELFEISRISRGKIELRREHVGLREVLDDALESARPLIEKKNHSVSVRIVDEPLRIFGDPVRLTQIAANIINNAAKYTPPGGKIEIESRKEGREVVLCVRDNGVGISADMAPRIFDLFAQTEGQIRLSEGGLGIGLALVRKLLDLHGGRIEASSDGVGRGSEFTVWLPISEAPKTEVALSEQDTTEEDAPTRAVVIDDDRDVADSFALLLESLGAEVRKAYDSSSGVALVETFEPNLIFVDNGMPDVDGYETARRIRAGKINHPCVLIALTGWGQEDDRRRAQEAGFDLHMTKPAAIEAVQWLLRKPD